MDGTQTEVHTHCSRCYKLWCSVEAVEGVSCLNVRCPQDCGTRLHACKVDDHLTRCPNTRVECLNRCNGCPSSMTRSMAAMHLIHCPANVVQCGLGFRRDDYMRHFKPDCEHDRYCAGIIAEKMRQKATAMRLAERLAKEMITPAHNYSPVTTTAEELEEKEATKRRRREEAMTTTGNLLVNQRLNQRPNSDLHQVPWQTRGPLLSESDMDVTSPASPLPSSDPLPMSPQSPLPGGEGVFPLGCLEALPFRVLKNVGRFLEPRDLQSLSATSWLLRRVCASLLQECGLVTIRWEKQVDDTWVPTQKIWQFSFVQPSVE